MLRQNKKLAGRVVIIISLALAGWLTPRPGLTAPLEVYGRLPSLENVALSPDGSLLALVHTTTNDRVLEVRSPTDHKLVGKSDLLRKPEDKRETVSYTPPGLGHTDRFLLVFRKNAS